MPEIYYHKVDETSIYSMVDGDAWVAWCGYCRETPRTVLGEGRSQSEALGSVFRELASPPPSSATVPRSRMLRLLELLVGQMDQTISTPDLDWEQKYHRVFSDAISNPINRVFRLLGVRLEYCDPDTTYRDDVRAFQEAVHEHRKLLPEYTPLHGTVSEE